MRASALHAVQSSGMLGGLFAIPTQVQTLSQSALSVGTRNRCRHHQAVAAERYGGYPVAELSCLPKPKLSANLGRGSVPHVFMRRASSSLCEKALARERRDSRYAGTAYVQDEDQSHLSEDQSHLSPVIRDSCDVSTPPGRRSLRSAGVSGPRDPCRWRRWPRADPSPRLPCRQEI